MCQTSGEAMAVTNGNAAVLFRQSGGVCVISINNPPVNTLAKQVRLAIAELISLSQSDRAIKAIVICGAGRNFCGGADIREFNTPDRQVRPMTRHLMNIVEDCEKPVLAAIHGPTLGGGLELALGCHYRIVDADAQLGLPEVHRGVVPGAGGTQRLPRLVGFRKGLEMITSGTPVDAATALEIGLVDKVVRDVDLVEAAIAYATKLIEQRTPTHRTSGIAIDVSPSEGEAIVVEIRASLEKSARGMQAPFRCLESVANTLTMSFEDGWAREAEISEVAVASDESRSLVHAFFAERQTSKIPDIPADITRREIEKVAILGAGTMGGGIAMSFANAGMNVTVIEASQENLDRGLARIEANYDATRKRGRLSDDAMVARMSCIQGVVEMDAIADADLVIEAVFEEMDVKKQVFYELDRQAKSGAILATNTSTLDVDAIAAVTQRPEDVLGMHFFSPANVMTLLEIVRARKTSPDIIATVLDLSRKLGKTGVVVGVCDGFVGNRMLAPYFRQADFLVEEGALPQDVDRVIEAFGFRMGPFRVYDLAGLDISWAIEKRRAETRPSDERFSPLLERICDHGRYGQKTNAGWYAYEDGRTARPDPLIEAMLTDRSAEMGINRRDISDTEILQRCVYALINEGVKILEEDLAIRSSDVDVIWLHGYGFPRWRGGPMFYADTVGLAEVVTTLDRFHAEWGDKWAPTALLRDLAEAGSSFKEWDKTRG